MYICNRCKTTTEELETLKEHRPYGDTNVIENMTDWECQCGGEYTEAVKCPVCNEWQVEGDFSGLCDMCKGKHLLVSNMLPYIKEKELEQDFFVSWWTGADVNEHTKHLTGICERDWDLVYKSHYSDTATKELIKFVVDDLPNFVEWFLNKGVK